MASYSSKVRADTERWAELGYIDRRGHDAIVADVEARDRRSLSFGSILAVMAALLFGAAILIFVASNWEAIPRLARVGSLFAIIGGGYIGGAILKSFDHEALAEGLWLVAAAAFGGSIALIGQMYHLSGDETQAVLIWAIGTTIAAAGLRSGPLTMAAVGLACAWLFLVGVDFWRTASFPHAFLAAVLILWLVSYWTRSAGARHLILLSLCFYGILLAVETDVMRVAPVMAVLAVLLFAIAIANPPATERIARLDGLLPVHGLIGFLAAMFALQFELADTSGLAFPIAAAVTIAGIIAAIVLAGRLSRGLRWIAYTGFAAELCLIYGVLIQDMLSTAGFFFAAGIAVGLLAFAIIRIERRLAVQHGNGG